eukprot:6196954-Pleurochrysis_carterae.AAC.1
MRVLQHPRSAKYKSVPFEVILNAPRCTAVPVLTSADWSMCGTRPGASSNRSARRNVAINIRTDCTAREPFQARRWLTGQAVVMQRKRRFRQVMRMPSLCHRIEQQRIRDA